MGSRDGGRGLRGADEAGEACGHRAELLGDGLKSGIGRPGIDDFEHLAVVFWQVGAGLRGFGGEKVVGDEAVVVRIDGGEGAEFGGGAGGV